MAWAKRKADGSSPCGQCPAMSPTFLAFGYRLNILCANEAVAIVRNGKNAECTRSSNQPTSAAAGLIQGSCAIHNTKTIMIISARAQVNLPKLS